MRIGLIAYSFALRETEPNPCDVRLAQAVERIVKEEVEKGNEVIVIAQWEVALALSIEPALVVREHRQKGAYLDSEEVTSQAIPIFEGYRITEVIPVANPFLHLFKCRKLVRSAGLTPLRRRIGWIGFDKDSLQWYTRGPAHLLVYTALQVSVGYRGKHIDVDRNNKLAR
ncbi:hypothetical protein A3C91_01760 [Candidatus Azambacteria bacterium RIFCSPHIGHO2_02_FULL_52_12]|uniref:Uncharacterized protein n=1 Tax=Candidatus Azambacteria bacterium RIFCSPLOWO2_01_FULL_46_25 TaxID=1797298 RepID=A0A1F5BVE0_9BACT|nr:MAG: hypothetical protein A3C91_01760 [Candidatus Azambacteria bacterium RIFCSPHIGHO2_02_FULL_52_12]OGD34569.1 MAG: hypothetical protein A2988_03620 [Candidatus Azambacteria bacterium RIFCSPLOWO2_01_FULL_46_25]OGD36443.1 MAG: hypothetical protein A2850_02120 [Candidatus Azambacteria bacterium RIFCSPHIGHO2_01_FULL_51_74]